MSKRRTEDIFLEEFYKRVQKECKKHDINCSLCFKRVHIYTQHEDFYLDPVPGNIVLMHQNINKEGRRYGGYHIQEGCKAKLPEDVVRYIVAHTQYRYTEDGRYRTDEELEAIKKEKEEIAAQEKMRKAEATQTNLTNRQKKEQYDNCMNALFTLLPRKCAERGWGFYRNNNFLHIYTEFEDFKFEASREQITLRAQACYELSTKMTESKAFNIPVSADEIMSFVENVRVIKTRENFVSRFQKQVEKRCNECDVRFSFKDERVYLYKDNTSCYFDITNRQPLILYDAKTDEVLYTFEKYTGIVLVNQVKYITKTRTEENVTTNTVKDEKTIKWLKWSLVVGNIVAWTFGILFAIAYFSL